MSFDLSTYASSSNSITMETRKSERLSQKQSHPVYNIDKNCPDSGHEADAEQVHATKQKQTRKRRGGYAGRRGGAGGQASGGRGGERGQSNTPSASNSIEVEMIGQVDNSTAMGVADLKATLDATREETSSYMRSMTSVLCTLFSVLTATQIEDIESSTTEMVKQDNLFNICINQAKSAAAVRDLTLKLASARGVSNDKKTNSPLNETIVNPQSFTCNTNRRTDDDAAATPINNNNSNAQTPRTHGHARNGNNQSNDGGTNNNEISSTTQTTNTARPDWLRKLDENRKYNLILFGIHDTNNKDEDHRIVDEVLWTIGCERRIANKTNIIRLGNKKPGRSRLLMVCFNSETAASQVLNRSTNLVRSASLGHIYIKRDLPRDQRPPPKNRNSRVAEAARGASAVTPAAPPVANKRKSTDRHRSSSSPPPAPTIRREAGYELSDISSDSDFDGSANDCSGYITVGEDITEDKGEGVFTMRWCPAQQSLRCTVLCRLRPRGVGDHRDHMGAQQHPHT